jgi:arylsulfatase A-like enzyme
MPFINVNKYLAVLAAGAAACSTIFCSLASGIEQPNIVLINVDDLGYGDIGPFGNTTQSTPHLDRMAREGRKLTSHYGAPVCSPSRASLMTGCYPKRALPVAHVLFPASAVGLHPNEWTIAEVLKDAGYATACIGKWHLGDQPDFLPTRQGFDYYFGLPYSNDMGPASDGAKSNYGVPLPQPKSQPKNSGKETPPEDGIRGADQPPLPLMENERVIQRVAAEEQATLVRRYTEKAVEFMRNHRGGPFFVYFPHTAVHFPLYPSEAFRGTSRNGLQGDWVSEVDWSVGEVLKALDDLELADQTLVIFTSDNGGPLNHGASNAPLRGSKGSTLEGGIRVPTLCRWPGKIPAGSTTESITSMMDFLPTAAHLAGVAIPETRRIDGQNIWPLLSDEADAQPPGSQEFLYFRGLNLEAIRIGKWKLHLAKQELYDLAADIGEAHDIAQDHPKVVERLTRRAKAVDGDLGTQGVGPGCRELGRVEQAVPLIPLP